MSSATLAVTRTAILTGGGGMIGAATAMRLAEDGFNIVLIDNNLDLLSTTAAAIKEIQPRLLTCVADATVPSQVSQSIEETMGRFGRVDVIVNIAGGAGSLRARDIEDFELEAWMSVINLNLTSAFLFSRAVVPIMRSQNYGRIINFSSVIAFGESGPLTTVTGRLPYATSKAAILGFTKQLAKDVGEHGITVNALVPGLIVGNPGSRIRDRFDSLSNDDRNRMMSACPMGRPGSPAEVASAVSFLASEEASYVSGVALPIDGALL